MASAANRQWRLRLVELSGLVWGQIPDVQHYVETGSTTPAPPPPISPEVAAYMARIREAGKFVMPNETTVSHDATQGKAVLDEAAAARAAAARAEQ